ncbi:MAG: hypothetical protein FRX49_12530, partial [Trebouxia sp. A1-2]
ETADTLLPTWTRGIQAKAVGCFIIDAPMGLLGDTAWTLEQLVSVILQINCTFTPPFTIVIYSLYGMGELQRALADQASPQRGGVQEKLQLTNFIVVKKLALIQFGISSPVGSGPVNDSATDGGGFLVTDAGVKVNLSQKPLLELEFLLRVCHQGGWVVDLCCGSGSGLIAAMRLGYNVAGFDIKEAQVNATKARIQKFSEQEDIAYKAYTAKKGLPDSESEPDDVNDG